MHDLGSSALFIHLADVRAVEREENAHVLVLHQSREHLRPRAAGEGRVDAGWVVGS